MQLAADETGQTCVLSIRVRRKPAIFIVRYFMSDTMVLAAGVGALFINPAIPPLLGGRCSIIIIAILATMNGSLNRDYGLNKPSYLIKPDIVAIINMGYLALCLVLTVVVHWQFRNDQVTPPLCSRCVPPCSTPPHPHPTPPQPHPTSPPRARPNGQKWVRL